VTVHSFATQNQEMSFADFQSELLNHEMLMENQQQQSAETGNFELVWQIDFCFCF
jgi:hypothetical protein